MAEVTIIYWRDIPGQVVAGKGRGAVRAALPERFEKAIDRAAMRAGASESDAYLAEWRKGTPAEVAGEPAAAAAAEAERIAAEYDAGRLARLVENQGRA